jgi:tetratricopeptide (TPR) repeat protein
VGLLACYSSIKFPLAFCCVGEKTFQALLLHILHPFYELVKMKNTKFNGSVFVFSAVAAVMLNLATPVIGYAADTPAPVVSPTEAFGEYMTLGRAAVKAANWTRAIREFESAVKILPKEADGHNMLAFALRNKGDYKRAKTEYDEALRLNPKHLGAHEYIGELYLKTNLLAEAEKHLLILEQLCTKKCEEYEDLAGKIAAFKKK